MNTHTKPRQDGRHSPLPEPMLLEDEGAFLQRHSHGFNEEERHKRGHDRHARSKEKEGCPLQQRTEYSAFKLFMHASC